MAKVYDAELAVITDEAVAERQGKKEVVPEPPALALALGVVNSDSSALIEHAAGRYGIVGRVQKCAELW